MGNKWSGSERGLLSQRPERTNALATSTGRRLVMKCRRSRSRGTRLALTVRVARLAVFQVGCPYDFWVVRLAFLAVFKVVWPKIFSVGRF